MFPFCSNANPLGREDSRNAHTLDVVVCAHSKDGAEFLKRKYAYVCKFLVDVRDVNEKGVRCVELFDSLFVNVAPSSLIIHQSNTIIENGFYLLYL